MFNIVELAARDGRQWSFTWYEPQTVKITPGFFFPQLNRTYDSSADDFSSVLRAILCFYTRRALRALLSNAACKHERTPTYQPMRKWYTCKILCCFISIKGMRASPFKMKDMMLVKHKEKRKRSTVNPKSLDLNVNQNRNKHDACESKKESQLHQHLV